MAATKRKTLIYTLDALALVATVGIVIVALTSGGGYDAQCSKKGGEYRVQVADDQFSKSTLSMQRCDTVQVANQGDQDLHIAIGKHEKHLVYPGFTEQTIKPGEKLTFVARQVGRFEMHDHLRDTARTTLLIRERD